MKKTIKLQPQRKRGPKPKPRDNPVITCACGCGGTRLKYDNHYRICRFILYHHPKGFHHTEETKNKIRMINLGRKHTPEELYKMSQANRMGKNGMLGKKHSKKTLEKISISMVAAWIDRKKKLSN